MNLKKIIFFDNEHKIVSVKLPNNESITLTDNEVYNLMELLIDIYKYKELTELCIPFRDSSIKIKRGIVSNSYIIYYGADYWFNLNDTIDLEMFFYTKDIKYYEKL